MYSSQFAYKTIVYSKGLSLLALHVMKTSKEIEMQKYEEDLKDTINMLHNIGCVYSHTGSDIGYIPVNTFRLTKYEGRYGSGWIIERHWNSRFYLKQYFIEK